MVVSGLPEISKALDLVPRHYRWRRGDSRVWKGIPDVSKFWHTSLSRPGGQRKVGEFHQFTKTHKIHKPGNTLLRP